MQQTVYELCLVCGRKTAAGKTCIAHYPPKRTRSERYTLSKRQMRELTQCYVCHQPTVLNTQRGERFCVNRQCRKYTEGVQ